MCPPSSPPRHGALATSASAAPAEPSEEGRRGRPARRGAGRTPSLCVVGPLVGRNPGHLPTQGETLAAFFGRAGYEVVSTSAATNRYARLLDIVATLVRCRRRVDVVLLQSFSGPSFVVQDVASALARLFGHRVVMHLRGGALPEFIARYPRWARRVFGRADLFVAPSEFLARAVEPYGRPVRIVPNLIDVPAYAFRRRERVAPRLFWMRSFHPLYNPVMAVRVLARVRSILPEATLAMGGRDKGLEGAARAEAARLGVAEAVRFVGFLDGEGKAREGDAADIFINTNHVDNTPVSVIEACAMGLPVVATDVGGVRHLLRDGHTGLLVPDDDVEAMARAIVRLVEEPPLAERLSANGRELAERSSWAHVHAEWERIFAELEAPEPRAATLAMASR
jgi:glycosyltransferase involved in cell wall biosynthesis